MATIYEPIQPLYKTGETEGGPPLPGQGAYGKVPNLPKYTTDTQQTIGTDIYSQLLQNLPNYAGLVAQSSQNIGDWGRGLVGSDVANNLAQRAAEWGQGIGSPMSQAAATNFLSRYGLNSNALQNQAEAALTAAVQRTPIQTNQTQYQTTDWAAQRAGYEAAPNPEEAAKAALAAARSGVNAGLGGVRYGGIGESQGFRPFTPDTSDPMAGAYNWQNAWNLSQVTKDLPETRTDPWNPYTFSWDVPQTNENLYGYGDVPANTYYQGGPNESSVYNPLGSADWSNLYGYGSVPENTYYQGGPAESSVYDPLASANWYSGLDDGSGEDWAMNDLWW